MAELTLCAVLESAVIPELTRAFGADGAVSALAEGGLCAVVWRQPMGGGLLGASRRQVGEMLVQAQQILEQAQQAGPILAAAAGQRFADEETVRRFLSLNTEALRQGLKEFGQLRQHQVTVSWNPTGAMLHFRKAAAVAEALQAVAKDPGPMAGALLQKAMEGQKALLAEGFRAELAAATTDVIELPVDDPDMLLNVVAAIAPGGGEALDRALERIDAVWSDGLQVRSVGPLPAISFAAVSIDRIEPDRVESARRRLGVADAASLEEVETAFRAVLKSAHPDQGGKAEEARALVDARDLLVRLAALQRQLAPRELARAGLALLRREGSSRHGA